MVCFTKAYYQHDNTTCLESYFPSNTMLHEQFIEHNLFIKVKLGITNSIGTTIVYLVMDVLNENDPPVFSRNAYTVHIPETVEPGTVVFTVSATDMDDGLNGTIELSATNTGRPIITERSLGVALN